MVSQSITQWFSSPFRSGFPVHSNGVPVHSKVLAYAVCGCLPFRGCLSGGGGGGAPFNHSDAIQGVGGGGGGGIVYYDMLLI